MQTLTVQITNANGLKALHTLEEKSYIKIVDDVEIDSPSLPGKQLNLHAFKKWIAEAEATPSLNIKEAKLQWVSKRKQLQKLTK